MNPTIQRMSDIVWSKFLRMPYGHILDYVADGAEIRYPSGEECKNGLPNGLGWWTPIENGAFYTGLYTYSLIKLYDKEPSEVLENKLKILLNGLFLLQDVAKVEGFIARGVARDGKSHYPISSEDQVVPWVLALYGYLDSKACCVDKVEVKTRLLRLLTALKSHQYCIPTEWENIRHGSWKNSHGFRGVAKLLLLSAILADLSRNGDDLEDFQKMANEKPDGSPLTRLEIIASGFSHEMINGYGKQPWICVASHFGLHELIKLDGKNADFYRQGLYMNGITSLMMVNDMKNFTHSDDFSADWTPLLKLHRDCGTSIAQNISLALEQLSYWTNEIVPARVQEHKILGNSVYGTLIAVTSKNAEIAAAAYKRYSENAKAVQWEKLHLPLAYVAEAIEIMATLQ